MTPADIQALGAITVIVGFIGLTITLAKHFGLLDDDDF